MTEAELALKFIAYFSDRYEIYKEVPASGIIDFVATDGKWNIAVEVKQSLSIAVIEQAWQNLNYAHYSYVAVPAARSRHFVYQICKQYGIGVLEYKDLGSYGEKKYETIEEVVTPRFSRACGKWYKKLELKEFMKASEAGSVSNRMTYFKATVKNIVGMLESGGGKMVIHDVLSKVDHHYSSPRAAKTTLEKWIRSGVIKEFCYDDGWFHLPTVIVEDSDRLKVKIQKQESKQQPQNLKLQFDGQ